MAEAAKVCCLLELEHDILFFFLFFLYFLLFNYIFPSFLFSVISFPSQGWLSWNLLCSLALNSEISMSLFP